MLVTKQIPSEKLIFFLSFFFFEHLDGDYKGLRKSAVRWTTADIQRAFPLSVSHQALPLAFGFAVLEKIQLVTVTETVSKGHTKYSPMRNFVFWIWVLTSLVLSLMMITWSSLPNLWTVLGIYSWDSVAILSLALIIILASINRTWGMSVIANWPSVSRFSYPSALNFSLVFSLLPQVPWGWKKADLHLEELWPCAANQVCYLTNTQSTSLNKSSTRQYKQKGRLFLSSPPMTCN